MKRLLAKMVAIVYGLFSSLDVERMAQPPIIKFNLHPLMKRAYGKVIAGGSGGRLTLGRVLGGLVTACLLTLVVSGSLLAVFYLAGTDPGGAVLAFPALLTAKELREKRLNLHERQKEILKTAHDEERDALNSEEEQEFDRIEGEINTLGERIQKIESHEEREREFEQSRGTRAGRQDRDPNNRGDADPTAEERAAEEAEAFGVFLRHGMSALTQEQRQLMASRQRELGDEERALAAGVDAQGGHTVPEGFVNRIEEAMKDFGGMRESGAEVIKTDKGNDLPWPTSDDTGNVGVRIGENVQIGEQDVAFGARTLKAFLYSSKIIRVPLTLMQDSAFNLEEWLAKQLATRIHRITNREFTVDIGDPAAGPEGLDAGATLGKTGAGGQVASVTVDDITDLEHSVDPAHRRSPTAGFQFHDTTLKALKKLKDSDGRPLWQPGIAVRAPDTLNGYRYTINQDVAQMAASAKSIFFGDMSKYKIRDARGITLLRLVERYADFLQVGFLAFSRHDGRLLDAGSNPIKFYQNPAA